MPHKKICEQDLKQQQDIANDLARFHATEQDFNNFKHALKKISIWVNIADSIRIGILFFRC